MNSGEFTSGQATGKVICLAVLPLQNLSDDPQIEIICTGLVIDLITDLSRFRSFQMISYDAVRDLHPNTQINSSTIDHLAADYVVKGLARFHHDTLLFNIHLIDARTNRLVWAEKFKSSREAFLTVQEDIVQRIVTSLHQVVDEDVLSAIRNKPDVDLGAYECWLRGFQELHKGTPEADEQARVLFDQALSRDPHFARAYTGMSLTYFNEWSCQVWDRWEVNQTGAFEWARKALELDERDHISAAILGKIYLFNGEYAKAEHFLRLSLRLNPNDTDMLVQIGISLVYLGFAGEALALYRRAKRLNPASAGNYAVCGVMAYCELGEYADGIALYEEFCDQIPFVDFPAIIAAAYYKLGQTDKMWAEWNKFLERFTELINQGNPTDDKTAIQWVVDVSPYQKETFQQGFWEFIGKGVKPGVPSALTARRFTNQFFIENDLWNLTYNGVQIQLPDLKGLHDLSRLLAQPNAEVHCSELMAVPVIEQSQEAFDQKAKAAYQRRIREIQVALEDAEGNPERIEALESEYDAILTHLSESIGKGGKARKISGTIEKARSAVTWRIRKAIEKVAEQHPQLGKHLEASVKTGVFCVYRPEYDTDWIV